MIGQVHRSTGPQVYRSAVCGSRTSGTVQPRGCLTNPEGMFESESVEDRLQAQVDVPRRVNEVLEDHGQTGVASWPPGSWPTLNRINAP